MNERTKQLADKIGPIAEAASISCNLFIDSLKALYYRLEEFVADPEVEQEFKNDALKRMGTIEMMLHVMLSES